VRIHTLDEVYAFWFAVDWYTHTEIVKAPDIAGFDDRFITHGRLVWRGHTITHVCGHKLSSRINHDHIRTRLLLISALRNREQFHTQPLERWVPGGSMLIKLAAPGVPLPHLKINLLGRWWETDTGIDAYVSRGGDLDAYIGLGLSASERALKPAWAAGPDNAWTEGAARALECGANPNAFILPQVYTTSPLINASSNCVYEGVAALLKSRADPRICRSDGWSALMEAVFSGSHHPILAPEQDAIDIAALLVLYKSPRWPGGKFHSCSDGAELTSLADVPGANSSKYLRISLLCSRLAQDVPITAGTFDTATYRDYPQDFRRHCRAVAHMVGHPRAPNPFRALPCVLTLRILEIALGDDARKLVWGMVGARVWAAAPVYDHPIDGA